MFWINFIQVVYKVCVHDVQFFFYSLFTWVGSQQHEDPRVQWRKRRETMLCDYLVMVQSDLTVRKKICFSRVKNYWYESYLLVCSQNWTWPNTWAHKVITCNKRDWLNREFVFLSFINTKRFEFFLPLSQVMICLSVVWVIITYHYHFMMRILKPLVRTGSHC